MKIKTKIILATLSFIVLSIIFGWIFIFLSAKYNSSFSNVEGHTVPTNQVLNDIRFWGLRIVSSANEYGLIASYITENEEERREALEEEEKLILKGKTNLRDQLKKYEIILSNSSHDKETLFDSIHFYAATMISMSNELVESIKMNKNKEIIFEAKESLENAENRFLTNISNILEYERLELHTEITNLKTESTKIVRTVIFSLVMVVVIFLFISVFLYKNIANSLERLGKMTHEISKGNYNFKINTKSKDEFGILIHSVNEMAEKIRENEEAISRLSYQNKLILDSAGEGILGLDSQGNHTFINPAAAKMLGYEVDELLSMHSHTTWHSTKEDGSQYLETECPIYKTLQDGQVHSRVNEVFWRKDGIPFYVEYESTPILEESKIIGAVVTFNDITDRKQAETDLLESEEKFRKTFENSKIAMTLSDEDGNYIKVNRATSEIFGYSEEELLTMNVNDLAYPDEIIQKSDIVKKLWSGENKSFSLEKSYLHKDGHVIRGIVTVSTIEDSEGKVQYLAAQMQDITNRKNAENKLKESEEKYRRLTENAKDMIYRMSIIDGRYEYISPAALDLFGYTPDEFYNESLLIEKVIHPDWKEYFRVEWKNLLAGNMPPTYEYKIIEKSGKEKWMFQRNVLILDKNNLPLAIEGIVTDITERKQAEADLLESESKYRMLYANIPDAVCIIDSHGKISDINHRGIELLEYSKEELVKMTIEDLVYEDDKERSKAFLEKLQNEGSYEKYEGRIVPKSGKIKWVQVSSTQILENGIQVGSQDVLRDITKRKELESSLQKSNELLQESNATKDKFFSIIAHDLKGPFNSILGLSEILMEHIQNKNYDRIEKFTGIILRSSNNAFNLLLNLLEWSRSQSGTIDFNPEFCKIFTLFNETIELSDGSAQKKSITISTELPTDEIIFADKAMISTVLRNLISNAIKFTNTGGQVVVSAEQKEDNWLITVSDNGIGISKDGIKKLFRIEETISTAGTSNEKGTGLGLILCKEFIEKHSGKIWAESEFGRGSKFYFTIPNS